MKFTERLNCCFLIYLKFVFQQNFSRSDFMRFLPFSFKEKIGKRKNMKEEILKVGTRGIKIEKEVNHSFKYILSRNFQAR